MHISPSPLVLLVGVRPHHPHQGQALLRHAAGLREGSLHLGRYPEAEAEAEADAEAEAPSIRMHTTKGERDASTLLHRQVGYMQPLNIIIRYIHRLQ